MSRPRGPMNPPGYLAVKCTYLKRMPGREDCLGCERVRCVHDGELPDRRQGNKERPRLVEAGALSKAC